MARKPADVIATAPRPQGRDVIWAAIRKLREFTLLELEHKTRINTRTIRTYIEGLTRAGYLEVGDTNIVVADDDGNVVISGNGNVAVAGTGNTVMVSARDGAGKFTAAWWRLIRDVGIGAPRVTRAGKPVTQGQSRLQMWRAMRSARTFTYGELAYIASTDTCVVSEVDAKSYTLLLARAGYLAVIEHGRPRHQTVFRLARNTGPKPPQIQRFKQVWDPNLKQVMWTSGGAA
jgi:hypothetical protein